MGTAKLTGRYVGRIGALAVALGVGMAISANSTVAEADTGSAKSPTTSSSDAGKARSGVRPPKPASRSSAQRTGSKVAAKPVAVNKAAGTARTPLIGAAPTAPTPRAALLALAGWLRREYEYSVLGRRPVITPTQLVASSTSPRVVLGTMNASGPNAKLSYKVTEQPHRGTVTIDAFGQWTYTPVDGFPTEGGVDEFTVKVTDKAVHLANLFGAPAYTSTVTVPVSVPQRSEEPDGTAIVFTVTNSTKHPLNVHYELMPPGVEYPRDRTVLWSGQVIEFQVADPSKFPESGILVDFYFGTQLYAVKISAWPEGTYVIPYVNCFVGGKGTCNSGPVTQVVLLDAPGTSTTIPTAEARL